MPRRLAALAAIILLALTWPALTGAIIGLALAYPTLTAVGLLAYAYPSHTRRAVKRTGKVAGIGFLATAQAIRPRRTTHPVHAPEPAAA